MSTSKEERRLRARARESERAERTPQEQLAVLDARLGENVGAERERARLRALITNDAD